MIRGGLRRVRRADRAQPPKTACAPGAGGGGLEPGRESGGPRVRRRAGACGGGRQVPDLDLCRAGRDGGAGRGGLRGGGAAAGAQSLDARAAGGGAPGAGASGPPRRAAGARAAAGAPRRRPAGAERRDGGGGREEAASPVASGGGRLHQGGGQRRGTAYNGVRGHRNGPQTTQILAHLRLRFVLALSEMLCRHIHISHVLILK